MGLAGAEGCFAEGRAGRGRAGSRSAAARGETSSVRQLPAGHTRSTLHAPHPAPPPPRWAVVLTRDGAEKERLTDGAYFGEKALVDAAPRDVGAYGARRGLLQSACCFLVCRAGSPFAAMCPPALPPAPYQCLCPCPPPAAADSYTVCYALGRKAFNELLGPIQDVWRYEALRKASWQQLGAWSGWGGGGAEMMGGGRQRWSWRCRCASPCRAHPCCQHAPPAPLPSSTPPPPQVPILSNLTEQQLFQLAGAMEERPYAAGADVFKKGDEGDTFYVVTEGSFRCERWAAAAAAADWRGLRGR